MIQFWVDGKPIPQGSMRSLGNGRMIHSQGSALALWRSSIALAARFAGAKPLEGAMGLDVIFHVQRPKSVKRASPSVAPDLDKYLRSVGDALAGICYIDDSQIVNIKAKKVYSDSPGAEIKCYQIVI